MRRTFNICLSLCLPCPSYLLFLPWQSPVPWRPRGKFNRRTEAAMLDWLLSVTSGTGPVTFCSRSVHPSKKHPSPAAAASLPAGVGAGSERKCSVSDKQNRTQQVVKINMVCALRSGRHRRQPVLLDQLPASQQDSLGQAEARPLDSVWALGLVCAWPYRLSGNSAK